DVMDDTRTGARLRSLAQDRASVFPAELVCWTDLSRQATEAARPGGQGPGDPVAPRLDGLSQSGLSCSQPELAAGCRFQLRRLGLDAAFHFLHEHIALQPRRDERQESQHDPARRPAPAKL